MTSGPVDVGYTNPSASSASRSEAGTDSHIPATTRMRRRRTRASNATDGWLLYMARACKSSTALSAACVSYVDCGEGVGAADGERCAMVARRAEYTTCGGSVGNSEAVRRRRRLRVNFCVVVGFEVESCALRRVTFTLYRRREGCCMGLDVSELCCVSFQDVLFGQGEATVYCKIWVTDTNG